MSSSQADVGIILRQNDDAILHDAQDDAPEAKYDGPVKGTRIDVYNALEEANFIGVSSFAGIARGRTLQALPSAPGLFI